MNNTKPLSPGNNKTQCLQRFFLLEFSSKFVIGDITVIYWYRGQKEEKKRENMKLILKTRNWLAFKLTPLCALSIQQDFNATFCLPDLCREC